MEARYRPGALLLLSLAALCSCTRAPRQVASAPVPAPAAALAPEFDRAAATGQLGFDEETLGEIERTSGAKLEPIEGMEGDLRGVQVAVDQGEAETTVAALQAQLGQKGYLVFISDQGLGADPARAGIVKGTDPYDILRAVQTDGANYDITNEQVIAKLKTWEQRYPFTITGAGLDWVEVRFTTPPADAEAFAEEAFRFCPDIVSQGTGSVSGLADEIRKTQTLFLWWD